MIFAGIDTGTFHIGYAALSDHEIITCNQVDFTRGIPKKLSAAESLLYRMEKIGIWARDFAARTRALDDEVLVGIEMPWSGRNPQTAIKLAKVCGIIYSAVWDEGLQVVEVAPAQAKVALTNDRMAGKITMFEWALRLAPGCPGEHAADAIGVALATRAIWKKLEMTKM